MSILKYIKIILVLLFKAYLVYLWINSVETLTQLLYNIYVLKVSSLAQFGLFLFFLFGNICCILWLVLWCKQLPPAFNKPKIYYKIKDWIRSKKQEAPIYKVLFGSLLLFAKTMSCSVYLNHCLYCFKYSIDKWLVYFQNLNTLKTELLFD